MREGGEPRILIQLCFSVLCLEVGTGYQRRGESADKESRSLSCSAGTSESKVQQTKQVATTTGTPACCPVSCSMYGALVITNSLHVLTICVPLITRHPRYQPSVTSYTKLLSSCQRHLPHFTPQGLLMVTLGLADMVGRGNGYSHVRWQEGSSSSSGGSGSSSSMQVRRLRLPQEFGTALLAACNARLAAAAAVAAPEPLEGCSNSSTSDATSEVSSSSSSRSKKRMDFAAAAAGTDGVEAEKGQPFSTHELPLLLLALTRLQLPPSVDLLQLMEQLLLPQLRSYSLHYLSLICYCLGRMRYRPQQDFLAAAVAAFEEKAVAWEQQQQGAAAAVAAAAGGGGGDSELRRQQQQKQQQQQQALNYAMLLFGLAMMGTADAGDVDGFDQMVDRVDQAVDQRVDQGAVQRLLEQSSQVSTSSMAGFLHFVFIFLSTGMGMFLLLSLPPPRRLGVITHLGPWASAALAVAD